MTIDTLRELARIIERDRESLLARWREQVRSLPAARNLDTPTLNDHLPSLLVELSRALREGSDETIAHALADGSSPAHGMQRVRDAYDIEEVVAEYNILRGCLHDLAHEHGLTMQGKPFTILNRVLDGAIGAAVAAFATQKALEVQQRREEHLAFVAHDLRTPLSAISLSLRVLEMLVAQDPPATPETTQKLKSLKTLKRNVQRLESLIANVLKESTNMETEVGVKLERRRFDLWPLVEALIYDLHPVAGTDSTHLINEVPEDFVVYADAELLRRIFQNLIANAISYTPRGKIIIGARLVDDGSVAECLVRDNGAGIPEELRHILFEKHETDPDKTGGLGLGLAIVKTFVEAHDGIVTVETELGVGSTFRFTLPAQAS